MPRGRPRKPKKDGKYLYRKWKKLALDSCALLSGIEVTSPQYAKKITILLSELDILLKEEENANS